MAIIDNPFLINFPIELWIYTTRFLDGKNFQCFVQVCKGWHNGCFINKKENVVARIQILHGLVFQVASELSTYVDVKKIEATVSIGDLKSTETAIVSGLFERLFAKEDSKIIQFINVIEETKAAHQKALSTKEHLREWGILFERIIEVQNLADQRSAGLKENFTQGAKAVLGSVEKVATIYKEMIRTNYLKPLELFIRKMITRNPTHRQLFFSVFSRLIRQQYPESCRIVGLLESTSDKLMENDMVNALLKSFQEEEQSEKFIKEILCLESADEIFSECLLRFKLLSGKDEMNQRVTKRLLGLIKNQQLVLEKLNRLGFFEKAQKEIETLIRELNFIDGKKDASVDELFTIMNKIAPFYKELTEEPYLLRQFIEFLKKTMDKCPFYNRLIARLFWTLVDEKCIGARFLIRYLNDDALKRAAQQAIVNQFNRAEFQ